MMFRPVPVSAGCEYTTLEGSGRFLLRSPLIPLATDTWVVGWEDGGTAADVFLVEYLSAELLRLDLKLLMEFSRYDMMPFRLFVQLKG